MLAVGTVVLIKYIPATNICKQGPVKGKIIEQHPFRQKIINNEEVYWVTLDETSSDHYDYYAFKKDVIVCKDPNDILKDLLCLK